MPDGTLIVDDKYTHIVKIIVADGALLQVIGKGQAAKGPNPTNGLTSQRQAYFSVRSNTGPKRAGLRSSPAGCRHITTMTTVLPTAC